MSKKIDRRQNPKDCNFLLVMQHVIKEIDLGLFNCRNYEINMHNQKAEYYFLLGKKQALEELKDNLENNDKNWEC